jgi:hypothetical protein
VLMGRAQRVLTLLSMLVTLSLVAMAFYDPLFWETRVGSKAMDRRVSSLTREASATPVATGDSGGTRRGPFDEASRSSGSTDGTGSSGTSDMSAVSGSSASGGTTSLPLSCPYHGLPFDSVLHLPLREPKGKRVAGGFVFGINIVPCVPSEKLCLGCICGAIHGKRR